MKNLTLVLATLAIIPMTAFGSASTVECGDFGYVGRYAVLVTPEYRDPGSYEGLIILQTDPKETAYFNSLQKLLVKNGYRTFQDGVNYCIVTNNKTKKTVSVYEN